MKQPGQNFDIKKFLRIVLWVTLVIAIIEIPFIYFYFKKQETTPQVVQAKQSTFESNNSVQASSDVNENHKPENTEATSPAIIENIVAPTEKPLEPQVVSKSKDSSSTKKVKPSTVIENELKEKKELPVFTLSESSMNDVLQRLNAKHSSETAHSKCVKIRQTAGSNVANGFSIAGYLKKNGYTISGRETISSSVKGIAIVESGGCYTVTIGTME